MSSTPYYPMAAVATQGSNKNKASGVKYTKSYGSLAQRVDHLESERNVWKKIVLQDPNPSFTPNERVIFEDIVASILARSEKSHDTLPGSIAHTPKINVANAEMAVQEMTILSEAEFGAMINETLATPDFQSPLPLKSKSTTNPPTRLGHRLSDEVSNKVSKEVSEEKEVQKAFDGYISARRSANKRYTDAVAEHTIPNEKTSFLTHDAEKRALQAHDLEAQLDSAFAANRVRNRLGKEFWGMVIIATLLLAWIMVPTAMQHLAGTESRFT